MSNSKNITDAIKRGDKSILESIYKSALPPVVRYITANSGNKDDAKDVFQDAVMILIRQVVSNKYDDSTSVEPYLYTISKNLWLNKLKRNKKVQYVDSVAEQEHHEIISLHIERKEKQNTVKNALKQIGEKCYKLLTAAFYDEMSQKEIAEVLDMKNAQTVKTYMLRCRKKLLDKINSTPDLRNELIELYNI